MWCANCQADVAAEVTADTRRIHCAACGEEIGSPAGMRPTTRTREARELLERWASERTYDPHGPVPTTRRTAETAPPAAPPPGPVFRIDGPHSSRSPREYEPPHGRPAPSATVDELHVAAREAAPNPQAGSSRENPPSPPDRHVHSRHDAVPPPHFEIRSAIDSHHRLKTNWVAFWGQCLAYVGVLGLTVGTSMVVWGYFGGPERYTPTGWLVATAGQMLLFLGVVTLVSGGMEQTTDEVARRIDALGERLLRLEQATREHALEGPHTLAERFSGGSPRRTTQPMFEHRT